MNIFIKCFSDGCVCGSTIIINNMYFRDVAERSCKSIEPCTCDCQPDKLLFGSCVVNIFRCDPFDIEAAA